MIESFNENVQKRPPRIREKIVPIDGPALGNESNVVRSLAGAQEAQKRKIVGHKPP